MKTYTIILTLACAYQVAFAAVTIYQVPRPPTEAYWFANSTEFDFDGNSAFEIVVLEGNTRSIGNEVSIRSSTGFRVDFGTSVQVFASTEVSQYRSHRASYLWFLAFGLLSHLDEDKASKAVVATPMNYPFTPQPRVQRRVPHPNVARKNERIR